MGTSNVAAPYNAYNGKEVLDYIMRKLYDELAAYDDFRTHMAYYHFNYDLQLEIKAFPRDNPITAQIKGASAGVPKPGQQPKTVVVKSKGLKSPMAPDQAREEVGLEIPKPTMTSGGMVDRPSDLKP